MRDSPGSYLIKNTQSESCNSLYKVESDGVENWIFDLLIKCIDGLLFVDLCKSEIEENGVRGNCFKPRAGYLYLNWVAEVWTGLSNYLWLWYSSILRDLFKEL